MITESSPLAFKLRRYHTKIQKSWLLRILHYSWVHASENSYAAHVSWVSPIWCVPSPLPPSSHNNQQRQIFLYGPHRIMATYLLVGRCQEKQLIIFHIIQGWSSVYKQMRRITMDSDNLSFCSPSSLIVALTKPWSKSNATVSLKFFHQWFYHRWLLEMPKVLQQGVVVPRYSKKTSVGSVEHPMSSTSFPTWSEPEPASTVESSTPAPLPPANPGERAQVSTTLSPVTSGEGVNNPTALPLAKAGGGELDKDETHVVSCKWSTETSHSDSEDEGHTSQSRLAAC